MNMSDRKPAPKNMQAAFLNAARREKTSVMIYLVNGAKLTGRIRSFDKFSLLLEAGSNEQLVFKHAISTISQTRRASGDLRPIASTEASYDATRPSAQTQHEAPDSPEH